MHICVHLRTGANRTNMRSLALAKGMENAGHKVTYHERGEESNGDLYIQTGFAASRGLVGAIARRTPYIIAEAPFWRGDGRTHTSSSFGYNGLAGGAFRPAAGSSERPHPHLQELKTDGAIIIFGQKPTDHSLRGSDHADWIKQKLVQYPTASFRPHPLMVPMEALEPLDETLSRCCAAITYTSTVGAEALIAGCQSTPEHYGSMAYNVTDRERWIHELSWGQFTHTEYEDAAVANHVLSGYDEGRERAKEGRVEHPREKVNGQAIQREYDRIVLCPAVAERTLRK